MTNPKPTGSAGASNTDATLTDITCSEAGNMARLKDKAALSSQQSAKTNPHPQTTEPPSPVKAHIYRALAELNGGFEKVVQDLKTLQQVGFLRSERLAGMHDLICGIRAEANHECLGILDDREAANAGHFDGLLRRRPQKHGEI